MALVCCNVSSSYGVIHRKACFQVGTAPQFIWSRISFNVKKQLNGQIIQNSLSLSSHFEGSGGQGCSLFNFETGSQPCSHGWPGTHYVDQVDLRLTEPCLPPPSPAHPSPPSAGIKCVLWFPAICRAFKAISGVCVVFPSAVERHWWDFKKRDPRMLFISCMVLFLRVVRRYICAYAFKPWPMCEAQRTVLVFQHTASGD